MAGEIYQDVFDFSVSLSEGFTGRIQFRDENNQPINLVGKSVVMTLTLPDATTPEFIWSSINNKFTLLTEGWAQGNLAKADMLASVWQTEKERYPFQEYDYLCELKTVAPSAVVYGFTGKFKITDIR